jgi:hypothetical protein
MRERSGQALPGIPAAAAATGRPGRRTLLRAGLLAGAGAAIGGLTSAAFPGTAQAATAGQQQGWAFCDYCKGLYFSEGALGNPPKGLCPSRVNPAVGHSGFTYNYGLLHDYVPNGALQTGWKYCGYCAALFYGPGPSGTGGRCPWNFPGPHLVVQGVGSYDYDLEYGYPGGPRFQVTWNWCRNCAGLFFKPNEDASWCPINQLSQNTHDGNGSFAYGLHYSP